MRVAAVVVDGRSSRRVASRAQTNAPSVGALGADGLASCPVPRWAGWSEHGRGASRPASVTGAASTRQRVRLMVQAVPAALRARRLVAMDDAGGRSDCSAVACRARYRPGDPA